MLNDLPQHVQDHARQGFERWKQNKASVGWKRLNGTRAELYSVEIGNRYRAIGVVSKEHNAVVWMFVGSHETYNNFVEIRRNLPQENYFNDNIKKRLLAYREDKVGDDHNPRRHSKQAL